VSFSLYDISPHLILCSASVHGDKVVGYDEKHRSHPQAVSQICQCTIRDHNVFLVARYLRFRHME
jgi:hypothetical protein